MFTISWTDTKALEIPEGAAQDLDGYWYTDSSFTDYLNTSGIRNGWPSQSGTSYTASGNTLAEAVTALEDRIQEQHSKSVKARTTKADRKIEKTLAKFKTLC